MNGLLYIDGRDMTPYLLAGGFKWQRSDLDSSESQRLMDGSLERHYVTTKYDVEVTCRPLTTEEASVVLKAIKPMKLECKYLDPELGGEATRTCYANSVPAQTLTVRDGVVYWEGISFRLVEY